MKKPSRRSKKRPRQESDMEQSKISFPCILLVKDICIWAGREMKYVPYQIGNAIKISTLVRASLTYQKKSSSTKIGDELKALWIFGVLSDETWRNWDETSKWDDTWSLFGRHSDTAIPVRMYHYSHIYIKFKEIFIIYLWPFLTLYLWQ